MSKASKKRRRAERAAKQAAQTFGFGRVVTQEQPKGFCCPGCGKKVQFRTLTLTMVLQGLPCCGYVLTKHSELNGAVAAHRHERAEMTDIEIEAVTKKEREHHRSQPKYDTGGDF